MCGKGFLDTTIFGKVLMKLGLALVVVGHLNFIVGAIVHGLVLRHVNKLQDIISLQYSISNILTVVSAILSVTCGITAIVLSQYLSKRPLGWSLFVLSVVNTLLSALCTVGITVSVVITFVNEGRTLLATCTFINLELIQISHECPFDPTRIYSTSLCLWAISIFLDIIEVIFSIRLFLHILQLLEVKICSKTKVKWQLPSEEAQALNAPVQVRSRRSEEDSCL
ncbi:hypothetical protein NDU88_003242 [Pleurodeles waltl]|uniref:Transmembrane protein 54 n=1 Tax=Pleurodeles waltl TaxID=8319 RepID=A0AAV7TQN1_PLEWA|nr:hypothetical protein NDU88_003242 [Pleurodeles waltl]